jgi:hypothetical protein
MEILHVQAHLSHEGELYIEAFKLKLPIEPTSLLVLSYGPLQKGELGLGSNIGTIETAS